MAAAGGAASHDRGSSAPAISDADLEMLRTVFRQFDVDGTARMASRDLEAALEKLGQDPAAAADMLQDIDPDRVGTITFEQFVSLIHSYAGGLPDEGPDPKVMEFLRILDEYRLKCEAEGNYLEAERATKQLDMLRKQEEKRQLRALKARHEAEKQDVQIAHNMQFAEFNAKWDEYLAGYDKMARSYIQKMTVKHEQALRDYQQELNEELKKKPPKFSRELLEWRKREHMLAKQKKYGEAMKIKKIADQLEQRERGKMDEGRLGYFRQKEAKFRQQQQNELAALLKRIEGRRREHLKQLEQDSKRLLQRNRNVMAVLEQKQAVELSKKKTEVRTALAARARPIRARDPLYSSAAQKASSRGAGSGTAGGGLGTPGSRAGAGSKSQAGGGHGSSDRAGAGRIGSAPRAPSGPPSFEGMEGMSPSRGGDGGEAAGMGAGYGAEAVGGGSGRGGAGGGY